MASAGGRLGPVRRLFCAYPLTGAPCLLCHGRQRTAYPSLRMGALFLASRRCRRMAIGKCAARSHGQLWNRWDPYDSPVPLSGITIGSIKMSGNRYAHNYGLPGFGSITKITVNHPNGTQSSQWNSIIVKGTFAWRGRQVVVIGRGKWVDVGGYPRIMTHESWIRVPTMSGWS